jgi:hypothetical protein
VIASPARIRRMFGRIAPRYDLIHTLPNALLSLDRRRRSNLLATAPHAGRAATQRGPTAQRALDPIRRS